MASLRPPYVAKDGSVTHTVTYRHGGRQSSTTFENLEAAENFAFAANTFGVAKALQLLAAPVVDEGPTVDELFEKWIAWKARAGGVVDRTVKDYRRDYENWVQPWLGDQVANTVDELDVQRWIDDITGRLDPKTVADRHSILGQMFRWGSARSRQIVLGDPTRETQLPKRIKKKPKGFTLVEWDAIHEYAKVKEPDADDLLLFLVSSGWRFSESSALTAAHVEDYGDIEVSEGVFIPSVFVVMGGVHRRDANDKIIYVPDDGKSDAATRRINLPPEAATMVRRRVRGLKPADFLFTTKRGAIWRSTNFGNRTFIRILERAGISKVPGMGPHYLRHTHVALLDRAGVSLPKMQRRIGHASVETTIGVYGGLIDNTLSPQELAAADKILFDRAGTRPHAVVAGEVVNAAVVEKPAGPHGERAELLDLEAADWVEDDSAA